MFDPTTLLYLLPIALVVLLIFWIISRTGSFSLQIKDWFSISKEPELKTQLDLLMKEIEELKVQNLKLMEDNTAINNKLDYLTQKDTLKFEYKAKVHRVTTRFVALFMQYIESALVKKNPGLNSIIMRSLDEYTITKLIAEILRYNLTKKAMDDFDKNGFNKVGYNADGEYDAKLYNKYLASKNQEYTDDLLVVLSALEENRPYTYDRLNASVLLDRLVILNPSDMEKILRDVLLELDTDITSIYDFIITKYQSLTPVGDKDEGK